MDKKECLTIISTINEKEFRFEMPVGATFSDAYNAAHQCLVEITEMIKAHNDSLEKKESENKENNG